MMEQEEEKKSNNGKVVNELDEILQTSQEMGFKAAEFMKNKNFITAKTLLVQACENLIKLSKNSPPNALLKDLLSNFIVKAEECQQALKGLYKINVCSLIYQT